jgi:hypothetical protein
MRIPLVLVCGVVVSYCIPASAADDCGPGVDYYDTGYLLGEIFASGLWGEGIGDYNCTLEGLDAFREELDENRQQYPNPFLPCYSEGYNQALDDYYEEVWWSCQPPDRCQQMGSQVAMLIAYQHCGLPNPSDPPGSIENVCRGTAAAQCKLDVVSFVTMFCGSPTPGEILGLFNRCDQIIFQPWP